MLQWSFLSWASNVPTSSSSTRVYFIFVSNVFVENSMGRLGFEFEDEDALNLLAITVESLIIHKFHSTSLFTISIFSFYFRFIILNDH